MQTYKTCLPRLVGVVESDGRSRLHKATCGGRPLRKEAPTCRNDRAAYGCPAGRFTLQLNNLALSAARERQIDSSTSTEHSRTLEDRRTLPLPRDIRTTPDGHMRIDY